MPTNAYAAIVNCSDGTVQLPVPEWTARRFDLNEDNVYRIAAGYGPDKVLAEGDAKEVGEIKRQVMHAANNHNLEAIVVAGHFGCTVNPVSKSEHLAQIRQSVRTVYSWSAAPLVIGVWVDSAGEVYMVCEARDGQMFDHTH